MSKNFGLIFLGALCLIFFLGAVYYHRKAKGKQEAEIKEVYMKFTFKHKDGSTNDGWFVRQTTEPIENIKWFDSCFHELFPTIDSITSFTSSIISRKEYDSLAKEGTLHYTTCN